MDKFNNPVPESGTDYAFQLGQRPSFTVKVAAEGGGSFAQRWPSRSEAIRGVMNTSNSVFASER